MENCAIQRTHVHVSTCLIIQLAKKMDEPTVSRLQECFVKLNYSSVFSLLLTLDFFFFFLGGGTSPTLAPCSYAFVFIKFFMMSNLIDPNSCLLVVGFFNNSN